MKEIKEVTEKYKASEQALQNYKSTRRSNLGELQDDADERELLRQQREEVAMLKEQLQDQVEQFSEVHTGLFPAFLGKGPGQNWEIMIDLTSKLEEINDRF